MMFLYAINTTPYLLPDITQLARLLSLRFLNVLAYQDIFASTILQAKVLENIGQNIVTENSNVAGFGQAEASQHR